MRVPDDDHDGDDTDHHDGHDTDDHDGHDTDDHDGHDADDHDTGDAPAAPFTPPTTTAKKPVVEKPAVETAPTTPKKAVAGAFAQEPPKLAYTP